MPTEGSAGGPLGSLGGFLKAGRRLLGREDRNARQAPEVNRRASRRLPLRLPVQVCASGGKFRKAHLVDVNLRGLALELADTGSPGESLAVRFGASPGGVPAFLLRGHVVRARNDGSGIVGAKVSRSENSQERLGNYRELVLYYLRHRPLLEDVSSGYFEGRCVSCGWVGRVGQRKPICALCGEKVKPLTRQP